MSVLTFTIGLLLGATATVMAQRWRRFSSELPSTNPATAVPLEAYHSVFEASRDGLYLLDEDHRYLDVNASWLALLGCERDDLIGQPFGQQASRANPSRFRQTTQLVVKRSDAPRTLAMSCVQVELGEQRLTLGRANDVTQRERDRADLERLRTAVGTVSDAIFVVSREGRVVYKNAAARPWLETSLPQVRQHLKHGRVDSKFEVSTADAHVGNLRLNPTADGVIACIRDVTEERSNDERRRRAEARLHEIQRMRSLGILAGKLAHDFNNLLTGIHGFTILARGVTDMERVQRYLGKILRGSEQAAALTKELRQFSSHKAGAFEPLDLRELALDLERSLRGVLGESVKLFLELDEPAPVVGDAGQLRQLLLNLALRIQEGADAPHSGRVDLRLHTRELDTKEAAARGLPHSGAYVRVEFEDDVAPIAGDGSLKVFEPFAGSSEGLGLPAAYGIVMRHGGAIQVSHTLKGGARFTIFMPLDSQPQELADTETRGSAVPARTSAAPAAGRLLIVDDDELVLELASDVLRNAGFKVEAVSDGERALILLQNRPDEFALLLSDVILPGISGLDVVEQAQELAPQTRLLLMTGYTGARPQAGIPVIEKPFTPTELLRVVRRVLSLSPAA